jgi:hypothetical protein
MLVGGWANAERRGAFCRRRLCYSPTRKSSFRQSAAYSSGHISAARRTKACGDGVLIAPFSNAERAPLLLPLAPARLHLTMTVGLSGAVHNVGISDACKNLNGWWTVQFCCSSAAGFYFPAVAIHGLIGNKDRGRRHRRMVLCEPRGRHLLTPTHSILSDNVRRRLVAPELAYVGRRLVYGGVILSWRRRWCYWRKDGHLLRRAFGRSAPSLLSPLRSCGRGSRFELRRRRAAVDAIGLFASLAE